MPKTFVDAITITRHLGIRYIWIDSLCICQDDAEDWARESARMCNVYSKAHLILAANRSSDCSLGCFHVRDPRPQASLELPGIMGKVHATLLFPSDQQCSWQPGEFAHEPLSKRGWYGELHLWTRFHLRSMYLKTGFADESPHQGTPRTSIGEKGASLQLEADVL